MHVIRPSLASLLLLAAQLDAQAHDHSVTSADKLGTVHFHTSCMASTAPAFDHAVALLHSFEFGAAIKGFNDVLAADPHCAMADWGIALARWGNPMAPVNRAPTLLAGGRDAASAGTALGANAPERERGYISAVNQLYADYEHTPQAKRVVEYEKAMAAVAAANVNDTEATIFYALALIGSALPTDKTYANRLKAGAMLEGLWKVQPDHPGLAHYIIHAYDVPALVPQARAAAERYADIAPSAAHALHMPSHTFTLLGMWQESVNTNRRSVEAAMAGSAIGEAMHASDYMEYALLQMRQDSAAKAVLDRLPGMVAKFDPTAVAGAAPPSAGLFAMAAIPARYALERRAWRSAEALIPRTTGYSYTEAMTYFARALAAAHLKDRAVAITAIDSLDSIQRRLVSQNEAYWAEQVAIELIEARAGVDHAEGRRADASAKMLEAVSREEATDKAATSPGPLAPARELYGDMLMDDGRPADALVEYQKSLLREPNRYWSLHGGMLAAAATGDHQTESDFAAQLKSITGTVPRS